MHLFRNSIRTVAPHRRHQFWLSICSLLLAGASASARLATPYEHSGIVRSIDRQHQLIVLEVPPEPKFGIGRVIKPGAFVWAEETKFIKDGQPADATGLFPGARVRLFYRYSTRTRPPFLVRVLWSEKKGKVICDQLENNARRQAADWRRKLLRAFI